MQKNTPHWIKIDGKGKDYQYILDEYMKKMQAGFDLTIEEIAEYLSCRYNHVQRTITPHLSYVAINTVARQTLYRAVKEGLLDFNPLFAKRRLYSRPDFKKYILTTSQMVTTYHRFKFDDLSEEAQRELYQRTKYTKMTPGELFREMAKKSPHYSKTSEPLYVPLLSMPMKLWSLQDIKATYGGYNHNAQVYRMIHSRGVPKIKIGSLIRYQPMDINEPVVFALPNGSNQSGVLTWIEKQLQEA